MIFVPAKLEGSYIIEPETKGDNRGWFMRSFDKNEFAQIGFYGEWVQMNHSFTAGKGAIRGLHFQKTPYEEIKLVRCIAGSVFDVAVDLRKHSATYLQWFGTELSAQNKKSFYIPEGFAHGFQTLTENAELIYCHSQYYKPEYESGLRYNDPKINIQWPLQLTVISERDKNHSLL
ncbi:MAG: dTDP-4-dehydrorhamnose 3,5-epimerase [Arachidicoccus sp.]|nr:dTDP-4-dehydrorhamnose 3,5-epimerase [Arachidicoccus sp.]